MKKDIIVILFCFLFLSVSAQIKLNKFVYGAYNAGYTMLNIGYVTKIDYSDYNFYYLMCYPEWDNSDFDKPLNEIIAKYVTNFKYPDTDSKYGLASMFISNAHKAKAKVLLSLQGSKFSGIANNSSRSEKFAKMIVAFVCKYNYDGFDLDWEGSFNIEDHSKFLAILRMEFNKVRDGKYYYITTALSAWNHYSQEQADALSRSIDWINLMTYDLSGGIWGDVASYNTGLNTIQRNVGWYSSVFDKKKLCIGLVSYGFIYKGIEPNKALPKGETLAKYGSYISYTKFSKLLAQGWTQQWNPAQQSAFFFSPNGADFVTIDTPASIKAKFEWILSQGFRGTFWWELYQDFEIKYSPNTNDNKVDMILTDQVKLFINSRLLKGE